MGDKNTSDSNNVYHILAKVHKTIGQAYALIDEICKEFRIDIEDGCDDGNSN